MLELLRQLSAGNPGAENSQQAPVAQSLASNQSPELEAVVFSLPLLEVTTDLAVAEEETLLVASADVSTDTLIAERIAPLAHTSLPTPDLAEQWLSGMLGQQGLQVQAQSVRESVPVMDVAREARSAPVIDPQAVNKVVERAVLADALAATQVVRAPQAVIPVAQPLANALVEPAMAGLARPVAQDLAVNLEGVKPLLPEAPALAPNPIAVRAATSSALERPEQALAEQLMHKVRQSIDVQVRQNIQSATIRLDPPELGSLEIFLSHDSGRLQVSIQAANADVSRLLMQTSDRLRQDLVAANYLQVNVQVGRDGESGREQRRSASQQDQVLNAQVFDEPQDIDRTATDVLVTV